MPAVFSVTTYTNYRSSDYNGFRPNPKAAYSFQWNSPPWNILADYSALTNRTSSALVSRRFAGLAEYSRATQQDQHSIAVDYDIFVNAPRLDAQDVTNVQKLYNAKDFDFRLKPSAAAIDRGVNLPNVTDGFTGQAPDLGALEFGKKVQSEKHP